MLIPIYTGAYMDGVEITCGQELPGVVGRLDCDATAYMGLGHRIPGAWQVCVPLRLRERVCVCHCVCSRVVCVCVCAYVTCIHHISSATAACAYNTVAHKHTHLHMRTHARTYTHTNPSILN